MTCFPAAGVVTASAERACAGGSRRGGGGAVRAAAAGGDGAVADGAGAARTLEAAFRDYESGRKLPAFVRNEFNGFLECGLLNRGFAHLRCENCAAPRLVAFACIAPGFCPSCLGGPWAWTPRRWWTGRCPGCRCGNGS